MFLYLLPAFEYTFSFLKERVHAFLLVLGRKQEVEALSFGCQAFGKRRLESLEDSFLRHPRREWRFLGDLPRQPLRDRDGHLSRNYLVHNAQLARSLRRDRRAGEHDLHGCVLARAARPPLRAAGARDDAQVDLSLSEARRLSGDDHVAHQGDLTAAPEGVTVHTGDHRRPGPPEHSSARGSSPG